jgi:hypothetical protein
MVGFVGPVQPEFSLLSGNIPLIYWDQGDSSALGTLTIECGGDVIAAPILTLSAPLEGGGTRRVLVFAAPGAADGDIVVRQRDNTVLFSIDAPEREGFQRGATLLEPATLLESLSATGRVRVVRFLLQTCRSAFGLSTDQTYIDNIERLVDELSLRPGHVEPLCLLDRQFVLAAGTLPAPVGANPIALTISSKAVQEAPLPPTIERPEKGPKGRHAVLLAIPRSALSDAPRIVVFGSTAVAIRSVSAASRTLEPAVSWLVTQSHLPAFLRSYVLNCLTQLGQSTPGARNAAREALLIGTATGGDLSVNVRGLVHMDTVVAVSERLFIAGRITDPHHLVRSIDIGVGKWSARIDRSALQTFSAIGVEDRQGEDGSFEGFAVLAEGNCPVPQFGTARISLVLASGAVVEVAQVPLLLSGRDARDAILDALPASAITDSLVTELLLPAMDLIRDDTENPLAPPVDSIEIGTQPGDAAASLIMPLSADLGLIKTWSSALGGGVLQGAAFELVAVATSDSDLAAAERTLAALDRQFGIASRLVSVAAGAGPRGSYAAGAAAATRDHLLFLDHGCVPSDSRSLESLVAAAAGSQEIGLVGGVVLDPAGSVLHAGFAAPRQDSLAGLHDGFPASQLNDLSRQPVFACSASCLAVARATLEAVGGFSDGFLTRDWIDADLCLRARAAGYNVQLDHGARIIRYAGNNPEHNSVLRLAARLDSHRFSRDWHQEIEQRPGGENNIAPSEPDRHQRVTRTNEGNPRWAA